jgi:hypothetical protein
MDSASLWRAGVAGTWVVLGDKRSNGAEAVAGDEEIAIGIKGVSAEIVSAEWDETEGAGSRAIVGTEAGPDVDVDDEMRGAGDGESSMIVPAMEMMMASGTRVACRGRENRRRTRWAFMGFFARSYCSGRGCSTLRSDRQVRCGGTSADSTGRAAGSARPKTSGSVLNFCHCAFHFFCELSHLAVARESKRGKAFAIASQYWMRWRCEEESEDRRRPHRLYLAQTPAANLGPLSPGHLGRV